MNEDQRDLEMLRELIKELYRTIDTLSLENKALKTILSTYE